MDSTLVQSLMRGLHKAGGSTQLQNAVGVGKHLWNYGIPESARLDESGRMVLSDSDVTNPETVGDVLSMPANATPLELQHEQRHAAQGDILGPAMIAARPLEMLFQYGKGPLEGDAYRATEPQSELLRKRDPNLYTRLVESILQMGLGK